MTQGRRIYPDGEGHCSFLAFEPGDYGRDDDGVWYALAPGKKCYIGNLKNHTVTEHEDGTITVSPSILISVGNEDRWHGYLEGGIWREC